MNDSPDFQRAELRKKIESGQLQISEYLEQNRSLFLSDNNEDRTKAFNDTVEVVTQLPTEFLDKQQAQLLLNFLISQFEPALVNGYGNAILKGIWFLITKCKNVPNFDVTLFVKVLFQDNDVQKGWAQQERLQLFEICEWMLANQLADIQKMGSDFAFAFEHAMAGERDPRCLVVVFKLFQTVAHKIDLGAFASDLFEAVACYFPISFRPAPTSAITRDELAASCISCLTASPVFAQNCFFLIEEKLQDDEELAKEQREDVNQLLLAACSKFPPLVLAPRAASIVNELIGFILNPNYKGSDIKSTLSSITCVLEKLDKLTDKTHVVGIIKTELKHIEPFVLQAGMGITARALQIAKQLVCIQKTREDVFMQVYAWLIELIQGTGSNAALNKADLIKEALDYLLEWIQITLHFYEKDKSALYFQTLSNSLFTAVDASREFAPTEGIIAYYELATAEMQFKTFSADVTQSYVDFFLSSIKKIDVPAERSSWMKFVRAFALRNPDLLNEALHSTTGGQNLESNRWFYTLCASIVDAQSWYNGMEMLIYALFQDLTMEKITAFVDIWNHFTGPVQQFIPSTFVYLFSHVDETAFNLGPEEKQNLRIGLQMLAAKIEEHSFEAFFETHFNAIMNEEQRDVFYMIPLLTKNVDFLRSFAKGSTDPIISRTYEFAAANKDSEFAVDLSSANSIDFRSLIINTKAAILRGATGGIELLKKLLERVSQIDDPQLASKISEDLVWLLEFSTPDTSVELCRYRATMLWQQRILVQFVQVYCSVMPNAKPVGRSLLLQLLPKTFELGKGIPDSGLYFQKLLPFMIDSLNESFPSSQLDSILASLCLVLPSIQVDAALLEKLVPRLVAILQIDNASMSVLISSLDSLLFLSKSADKRLVSSFSSLIRPAVNQLLGHKKRLVRKKVAIVNHTWSPLTQPI
ncbi:hypothetical protein WR25_00830 [Diploscapter pachys]|uniref:MMS19 nucleotide excision repair protein n=1 Tax=Diploscapter pachys TaxID=2018661 RepID=A0A2A2JV43_9BILA|nr:hypothetical protein WR25_00830 [Diploscapter pachys]